jgi:hypothetical protein
MNKGERSKIVSQSRPSGHWIALAMTVGLLIAPTGRAAEPTAGIVQDLLAQRATFAQFPDLPHLVQSTWQTTGPLRAAVFSDVLFPGKGVDLDQTWGNRKVWQARDLAGGVVWAQTRVLVCRRGAARPG